MKLGSSPHPLFGLPANIFALDAPSPAATASAVRGHTPIDAESSEKARWRRIAQRLCDRHRSAAKTKGIAFTITWRHIYPTVVAGRCELTGIQFKKSRFKPNPFASSIDRIDSTKGYIPGNVRVVLWAINCACSVWGHEVFAVVARAYVEKLNAR